MTPLAASFRDPSGFVFSRDGVLFRQVNASYQADYERLVGSGLYADLAARGELVAHEEVATDPGAYRTLRPTPIPLVTYPYEWCFGQLKDAALLTLRVQRAALQKEMWLKDATAYNVQWLDGRPVLIDTLSFEAYPEGKPWVAYRQFCQHFLAPLALMAKSDIRLGQLLRVHLDGVPLDLASALLPYWSRASIALGIHVHAHARTQRTYAHDTAAAEKLSAPAMRLPKRNLVALVESLEGAVEGLAWNPTGTEWADYYERNNNYSAEGMDEKLRLVREFSESVSPATAWDLGANTGRFSRVLAGAGARVAAWDIDPACVEANYRHVVQHREARVLPLLLDLANPSPGLGWAGTERDGLQARGPVDLVLALGLVHHLAISNNVPLDRVASFLATLGRHLVIEWVPKEDSQVRKLLATREDVFPAYTRAGFEAAFGQRFTVLRRAEIAGTQRTLYLLGAGAG